MHLHRSAVIILLIGWTVVRAGAQTIPPHVDPWKAQPQSQLLLLGTFHFQGSTGDAFPSATVDMLSPRRQQEIEEVVLKLARFQPTRVAVEAGRSRQQLLDSLYQAYRAGDYELGVNEIYQLGFRLAARLGHPRVYAVDAERNAFFLEMAEDRYADADTIDAALHAAYLRMYEYGDSLLRQQTLREHLLYTNSAGRILRGHGHYLIRWFKIGGDQDDFGVDFTTGWYNRNLRIFRNIQRINRSSGERILVIIGSGHVPILRFAAQSSPEFELVEAADFLSEPIPRENEDASSS